MNTRFSLTLKQLFILILGAALLAVVLTVVIFFLGQQYGLNLARGLDGFGPTATPTMPPLPQAMTATPRPRETEVYVLTEAELNRAAQEQSTVVTPLIVEGVDIQATQMQVRGTIDYLGYQGQIDLYGAPYVENGGLKFRLSSITLDGQTLPPAIYPIVEEQIDMMFSQLMTGYDVTSVELAEDQITVAVIPW